MKPSQGKGCAQPRQFALNLQEPGKPRNPVYDHCQVRASGHCATRHRGRKGSHRQAPKCSPAPAQLRGSLQGLCSGHKPCTKLHRAAPARLEINSQGTAEGNLPEVLPPGNPCDHPNSAQRPGKPRAFGPHQQHTRMLRRAAAGLLRQTTALQLRD